MQSPKNSFAILILAGAGLLITALSFVAASPAPLDGAGIFKKNCSMCHGKDGKGFPALKTPNFTDPKWQKTTTDKEIVETIKNGKKKTAMPAFKGKLKDDEIQAAIGYVRSLGSSKQ